MIGVFDSGSGGISAVLHLRRLFPEADIAFLADRPNAPYGNKKRQRILKLAERSIERLCDFGCRRVLMACCTASTLFPELPAYQRELALPIILPTAEKLDCRSSRILVIATEHTVSCGAFGNAIRKIRSDAEIYERSMQTLVRKIEEGRAMGNIPLATASERARLAAMIEELCPDTLILGCTHFSWIEELVAAAFPHLRILNPAKIGAERLLSECTDISGNGRTFYME